MVEDRDGVVTRGSALSFGINGPTDPSSCTDRGINWLERGSSALSQLFQM